MTARALLVGVPHTTARSNLPDLDGIETDTNAVKAMLLDRGFTAANVSVPDGRDLEAARLQAQLLALAEATKQGDLAIFYFAGHGYSTLDGSGDETGDDWDECLVCADRLLLDDWFHDVFWKATQPGSRWVTCVDACHSATSTLAIDVFHDPPPDHAISQMPVLDSPRWRLLLAACGDGEDALELADRNGMARGAMTDAMLRSLHEFPDASYARRLVEEP